MIGSAAACEPGGRVLLIWHAKAAELPPKMGKVLSGSELPICCIDITATAATRLKQSDLIVDCLWVVLHHLSSFCFILEAIQNLLLGLLLVPEAFFHLGGHRPFHVVVVISSFLTFNVKMLLSSCPFFQLRILLASVFPDFVHSGTAVPPCATVLRFDSVPVEQPGPLPHSLKFCLQRLSFRSRRSWSDVLADHRPHMRLQPVSWRNDPLLLLCQPPCCPPQYQALPVEFGLQPIWQLPPPPHPAYSFLRLLADFQHSLAALRKATPIVSDFRWFPPFLRPSLTSWWKLCLDSEWLWFTKETRIITRDRITRSTVNMEHKAGAPKELSQN